MNSKPWGEPMAMTEQQKQIMIAKTKAVFQIIWAILKPLAFVVLAVGVVVFGALISIIGSSFSGKGRR
jgi:hypothetical protein